MIIAVHQEETDSTGVSFCQILHVDMIHSCCTGQYVKQGEAKGTVSVSAGAIAGIEDMMKRKPIQVYSAAPASASERALGDMIIALRC